MGNDMRRFKLIRTEDVSGLSGTGYVAEGCLFRSGKCVLSWNSDHPSLNVYDSLDDILFLHGHAGRTTVEFIDDAQHDE